MSVRTCVKSNSEHELEYMFVCVYVFSCTEVLVDVYSVLFCSCTGTQEMPALMEAEAVVAVLIAQTCRLLL